MPDHLSVSQITTFLQCPRKYRFRYIDELPRETRSAELALGSSVHEAIAWWFSKRMEGQSPELPDVLRVFRADWKAQVDFEKHTFEKTSKEDSAAMGERLLGLFVERFASDPVPEASEERFEVRLVDHRTGELIEKPLVGYLDFRGEGYLAEVKTTSKKSTPGNWEMQLAAYSYAARETTGVRPRLRVVQLVKTATPSIHIEELTLTDRHEAWFVEVAVEVAEAIETGAFFPAPGWWCRSCEHSNRCRQGA